MEYNHSGGISVTSYITHDVRSLAWSREGQSLRVGGTERAGMIIGAEVGECGRRQGASKRGQ